jgi:hypothetical protein
MNSRLLGLALAVVIVLAAVEASAQAVYRWVDERGNVHYVGRRDQVPDQYRSQLPPEGPTGPTGPAGSPAGPSVSRGVGGPVTGECVLRFRGTERRDRSSRSFPSCDACWKALKTLQGEDAGRAECVPTSVESYR